MPRKSLLNQRTEQDLVLAVIRDAGAELQHDQIRDHFLLRAGRPIAYTTLRKRLDELLAIHAIVRTSERRNPRYSLPDLNALATSPIAVREASQPFGAPRRADQPSIATADRSANAVAAVPLSDAAQRVRAAILHPRSLRQPVAYTDTFLGAYAPGQTWYLPLALRTHLADIGRTAFAGQPAGTYARDIMQRLIIDLSWGSSKLEGNKFTRIDTEELLAGGNELAGASPLDRQMILNHKAAIEFLVENAQDIDFNRHTILGLHALLAENLLGNADDEGALRTRPIAIGASVYTPTAIPQVIEHQFQLVLSIAQRIPDPMEQAFFIMVHLPYLQPFIDVNKRTSRLAANIPLIKANLCPLSFVDVPEDLYTEGTLAVYELNDVTLLRDVFVWAYERSCTQFKVLRQSMGEPDPIRLRYRSELRAVVASAVRDLTWPSDASLAAIAAEYVVPQYDRALFVTAVLRDLRGLRAETLTRYQLRVSEFEAWITAVGDRRLAHDARS